MPSSPLACSNCGTVNLTSAAQCTGCGQALSVASAWLTGLLPPDYLLRQRYRIVKQVGKGGFGAVYQGQDAQLANRLVAIKEMSQRGLTPEELQEATEAFERETHLLATLSHPCLPAVYDYFSELGRTYLVMEFIQGETLEGMLSKTPGGTMGVEEALPIGLQLCDVLEYLHTRQPSIIFRDLKPSNVMFSSEKHLYLIDFGIARHFKPGQSRDTVAFGSPGYAAPEQYGKAQTTVQADIYSLGATLHHLLSGHDPSLTPFLFAPLHLPASGELEALVGRMLEQDARKRPASMTAIKQEFERLLAPASTPLPPVKTQEQWMEEAKAHVNAERHDEALAAYEQVIFLDPANANAYIQKGIVLGALELYHAALVVFEQGIHLDPQLANAYFNKGAALNALHRYEEAVAAYEQVIRLDPTDVSAYLNKGAALFDLQRPAEAFGAYDQAIRLDPTNARLYRNKGDALENHEYYQEAVTAYDQALRLHPKDFHALANKGLSLAHLGRYKEALTAYQQAIRLNPTSGLAHYCKGVVLDRLGRRDEAMQAIQKARQLGYKPE
jgi:tetratricopeptide (TPR) repeat protein/tRNA A-37 threonylcarbamoyl transferase component Bud32